MKLVRESSRGVQSAEALAIVRDVDGVEVEDVVARQPCAWGALRLAEPRQT